MDQQRRLLFFCVLSFAILYGWMALGPKLFPAMFVVPQKQAAKPDAFKPDADDTDADDRDVVGKDGDKKDAPTDDAQLPNHPTQTVVIGSDDPKTGYGLRVTLTSVGAGIATAELNDPRYKALKARKPKDPIPPLSLLGNNLPEELSPLTSLPPVTGHLSISDVDRRLARLDPNASLSHVNWQLEKTANDVDTKDVKQSATFRLKTPDGRWELQKKYELLRWKDETASREVDPTGYQLSVQLSFKNLTANAQSLMYQLQGPAGVPLENAEHTTKFRDVKFGFRAKDGSLKTSALTISELIKANDNNKIEDLKAGDRSFQYVGIDTQYFAALVVPDETTSAKSDFLDLARPQVVKKNAALPSWSEISLTLYPVQTDVPPESEVQHNLRLYLGPKRTSLLAPLGADKVIEFSGFLFIPASLVAVIAGGLLWVLNGFHSIGLPYGICIMLLTVLVRSCMFPISKKQANNAKKMKEIQPKLAELKAKHGDDKQKMAQAQMELFAQHGFNPLGGCLPLILQLPIFIGLYQSLSSSVDLRRAPFLWFDNLAAPDYLLTLPFTLPFVGNEFNLLPILTTTLFLVQQKMFMPPPTDEQSRMQAKVFFWMTLMMGFMFYHVPAGLCVYFIASSLWSMGERKLLDYGVGAASSNPNGGGASPANPTVILTSNEPPTRPTENFWSRLRDRLEEMGEMKDVNGIPATGQRRNPKDKDKKKSRS